MGNLRDIRGAGMSWGMQPGTAKSVHGLVDAAVRGELEEAEALRLCQQSPELVSLALLAAAKRIAQLQGQGKEQQPSPATPSGMVPVYAKPNATKRRKKPGAKDGHPGHRRKTPTRVDKQETHRLKRSAWIHEFRTGHGFPTTVRLTKFQHNLVRTAH